MTELAWEAWLVIVLALAAGGLTKGLAGLGLPGIAIPIMAIFLGVEQAVMIMVLPTLSANLWLAWRLRDCYGEVPEVPRIAIAGIPGIAVGATVLYLASERFLATVLALWVLAYLVLRFVHPKLSLSKPVRRQLAAPVGFLSGILQGATGICAPVIVPYVDALGTSPRTYVFVFSAVFMSLSLTPPDHPGIAAGVLAVTVRAKRAGRGAGHGVHTGREPVAAIRPPGTVRRSDPGAAVCDRGAVALRRVVRLAASLHRDSGWFGDRLMIGFQLPFAAALQPSETSPKGRPE